MFHEVEGTGMDSKEVMDWEVLRGGICVYGTCHRLDAGSRAGEVTVTTGWVAVFFPKREVGRGAVFCEQMIVPFGCVDSECPWGVV